MNSLPFGPLHPYKPRRFMPNDIDFGDWTQVAPVFERLESRAPECKSLDELERWIIDWSEVSAALDEESAKRYIAMTCHTDDAQAEKAYLHFVEKIEPELKPRQFALAQVFIGHPLCAQLATPRFEIFIRDTKEYGGFVSAGEYSTRN